MDDYFKLVQSDIHLSITDVSIHWPKNATPEACHNVYNQLVSSRLSQQLNDASLLIGRILELQESPANLSWPAWAVERNTDALQRAARAKSDMATGWGSCKRWSWTTKFEERVTPAIASLHRYVTRGRGQDSQELELYFKEARRAFLDLAVAVEMTLGDILDILDKKEALASLTADMESLKLGG